MTLRIFGILLSLSWLVAAFPLPDSSPSLPSSDKYFGRLHTPSLSNQKEEESSRNENDDTMAATSTASRLIGKLHPDKTLLMLCDMQERFRPLIHKMQTVIQTTQYMTSVASALQIPILATQQYTKVFGPTIPECFASTEMAAEQNWTTLEQLQTSNRLFEKKKFSMCIDDVQKALSTDPELSHRTTIVLVGIEAHVCVQQTCLDLLEQGKEVHLIVDAVSSQQPLDRSVALQRMQAAGAFVTTAQSAAFMLMQSADHANFKTVSKLTVEHMKLENEFNTAAT